jgi:glycosyltransferase involved in cell wall biosynthesis
VADQVGEPPVPSSEETTENLAVLVAGTFDRDHPRNALALAALEAAGVRFESEKTAAGAIWVGHPALRSLPGARRLARGRPVVANATDELVDELGVARRQLLRLTDLVVAETAVGAGALAAKTGLALERFSFCPTGAPEIFTPPWTAAVPFTCLALAEDEALVAETAALVPEVRFRIVGRLPAHAPPNVGGVTALEPESLAHELRRAGCVAVSVTREPRAIPEVAFLALACGAPLVTVGTDSVRELVAGGESALLVAPGDPAGVAAAVSRLNADFELSRQLSSAGLAAYREHAGLEARARRWRKELERQIGTASRRR